MARGGVAEVACRACVLGATDESNARPVFVAVVVVGEAEQFERLHPAVVTLEVVELLALAAEFVGVDADPAMAGVEQGRAGLGGAGEFGFRDLFVADDHRPVDEGFVTELLAAVVGRRRSRFAVDADPRTHEAFRPDQLDAEAFQFGRGDVDEVLGDVQLEFDRRRFVFEREVGQPGDEGDPRDGVVEGVDEQVEVPLVAGHITCRRVPIPDVVGRAPTRRIAVVDQFEPNDPGCQRVVGDDEPNPGHDHRLAAGPTSVAFEFVAKVVECDIEAVGVAADHVVGFRQCAEGGTQGLHVGPPLLAEIRPPSALREEATGDAVDEAPEDLVDVGP